jgi:hypothetical protein
MTYACPASEFAADAHLIKLQCLQNRVLHTTGKFPRNALIHDMHITFQIHAWLYIEIMQAQSTNNWK